MLNAPKHGVLLRMLKRLVSICLIIVLISSHFSRFFIYAGFELNKKYIASTLCENRDKPWLQCEGNCYFMKKIKQAKEDQKNQQKQLQQNLTQEMFVSNLTTIQFHQCLLQVISTPYTTKKTIIPTKGLFRPPKTA